MTKRVTPHDHTSASYTRKIYSCQLSLYVALDTNAALKEAIFVISKLI
jgi:hypothetical protein